jgi:putative transposase
MKDNKWLRLLAYITGMVNQRLLLQCEYLAAENRILRSQLPARLRLSDEQRSTLAEIGKRLGRKYLAEVACAGQTGHHSGLVPAADCTEVRWL